MNDRIQKLAEQAAGNFTQTFRWEYIQEIDKGIFNKFAELIVNECIAVHVDDYGVDIIGDVLKKHFGVDE